MKMKFKIGDIILMFILFLLSLIPTLLLYNRASLDQPVSATIQVNQNVIQEIDLTDPDELKMVEIPEIACNEDGVEIKNRAVRIRDSSCPDQICVQTGFISEPNQVIICLPHRVVIELTFNDRYEDVISY